MPTTRAKRTTANRTRTQGATGSGFLTNMYGSGDQLGIVHMNKSGRIIGTPTPISRQLASRLVSNRTLSKMWGGLRKLFGVQATGTQTRIRKAS